MNKSLSFLFEKQLANQKLLINKGLYEGFGSVNLDNIPVDDPKLMSYHIQQLVSEIGEILEADKRWKNFRNGKYNKESCTKVYHFSQLWYNLSNLPVT